MERFNWLVLCKVRYSCLASASSSPELRFSRSGEENEKSTAISGDECREGVGGCAHLPHRKKCHTCHMWSAQRLHMWAIPVNTSSVFPTMIFKLLSYWERPCLLIVQQTPSTAVNQLGAVGFCHLSCWDIEKIENQTLVFQTTYHSTKLSSFQEELKRPQHSHCLNADFISMRL